MLSFIVFKKKRICCKKSVDKKIEGESKNYNMTKRLVISIDGGGVRGGIPAKVLCEIERDIFGGTSLQKYISATGGSSAGAIIATLLAVGTPITTIVEEMFSVKELKRTFTPTMLSHIPLFGRLCQKYKDDEKLRQLEEFIKRPSLTFEDVKMKLLVNTYNWTRQSVNLFHNFHPTGLPQTRIVDAVHASSCAPLYFGPYPIPIPLYSKSFNMAVNDWWSENSQRVNGIHRAQNNDYHCDGGLACNTSDMTLYGLAKNYWPNDEIFMISLGTGYDQKDNSPHKPFGSNPVGLLRADMLDTIFKAPNECRSLECCLMIDCDHYLRIEHPLPEHLESAMDLVEESHIAKLLQEGERWFRTDKHKILKFLRPFMTVGASEALLS